MRLNERGWNGGDSHFCTSAGTKVTVPAVPRGGQAAFGNLEEGDLSTQAQRAFGRDDT